MSDTLFSSVKLLMDFEQNSWFDWVKPRPVRLTADVPTCSISAADKKYGGKSHYNSGSTAVQLTMTDPAATYFTGDFCIEMWVNPTNFTVARSLYGCYRSGTTPTNVFGIQIDTSGHILVKAVAATRLTTTGTLTAAAWQHVAVLRTGTDLRCYIDGTLAGSATYSSTIGSYDGNEIGIGSDYSSVVPFVGYIDELRVTSGYPRYTAAFTPPASFFRPLSGVVLDDAGDPAVRKVRVCPRGGNYLETTSTVDGRWSFSSVPDAECSVVVLDDSAGTVYKPLIFRTTPQ